LNVAPWGGAARRLGTNPHAVAVPGPNATVAMSHDFATSVVAEGKLKVKFNRGEQVAPGIMRNGRGEPSIDPREYYADPPGSLITAGEHKGYGLSLAVEILGGILSGTGAARPDKGPVSNGVLMMCIGSGRHPLRLRALGAPGRWVGRDPHSGRARGAHRPRAARRRRPRRRRDVATDQGMRRGGGRRCLRS